MSSEVPVGKLNLFPVQGTGFKYPFFVALLSPYTMSRH